MMAVPPDYPGGEEEVFRKQNQVRYVEGEQCSAKVKDIMTKRRPLSWDGMIATIVKSPLP